MPRDRIDHYVAAGPGVAWVLCLFVHAALCATKQRLAGLHKCAQTHAWAQIKIDPNDCDRIALRPKTLALLLRSLATALITRRCRGTRQIGAAHVLCQLRCVAHALCALHAAAARSENKDLLQAAQMSNTCVAVTQIKIDPNDCDFAAPLTFHLTFDALRPLQNVQWRFSPIHRRRARDIVGAPDDVVELHRAAPADYAGAAHVACSAQLVGDAANCGVVRCALHECVRHRGAEVDRLGDLVCQVTADEATGLPTSCIERACVRLAARVTEGLVEIKHGVVTAASR